MVTPLRWVALALVLSLLAPSAVAWGLKGSNEPDTPHDRDDGYMWPSPYVGPQRRVYFNVVAEVSPVGVNPNVGALGTRIRPAPHVSYEAFLGVWRDCNGDGYLGLADGAVIEYPAVQLLDAHLCPPSAANARITHNDGQWVYELVPLGPADSARHPSNDTYQLARLYNDTGALVWGDLQAPDGKPAAHSCPVAPLPRGTTASTGGLVGYADCYLDRRGAGLLLSLAGGTGLAFEDPEHPERSDSPLDQHSPVTLYGDPARGGSPGLLREESDDPAATVWDCSDPKGGYDARDPTAGEGQRGALSSVDLDDPTGERLSGAKGAEGVFEVVLFERNPQTHQGHMHRDVADGEGTYYAVPRPSGQVTNPQGSWYDALNATEHGLLEGCDERRDAVPGWTTGSLLGTAYSPVEDDVSGVGLVRRQSDVVFDFKQNAFSYQESGTLSNGNLGLPFLGDIVGHSIPQDYGVSALRSASATGPGWFGNALGPQEPQAISRQDLTPEGSTHATFYASVGAAAVSTYSLVFPGATGAYGAEWCGGVIAPGAPTRAGWACDPTLWWRPDLSGTSMPRNANNGREIGARVGQAFQLRDVDCWDGRVTDDVYASLVIVSTSGSCDAQRS